ncbi:MAG: hypothetical protein PHC62_00120 [Candidatus Izemoplasmatales bacterium]|nr:hypothetical protein [Candidatus Izemoplasmatales bacterium]
MKLLIEQSKFTEFCLNKIKETKDCLIPLQEHRICFNMYGGGIEIEMVIRREQNIVIVNLLSRKVYGDINENGDFEADISVFLEKGGCYESEDLIGTISFNKENYEQRIAIFKKVLVNLANTFMKRKTEITVIEDKTLFPIEETNETLNNNLDLTKVTNTTMPLMDLDIYDGDELLNVVMLAFFDDFNRFNDGNNSMQYETIIPVTLVNDTIQKICITFTFLYNATCDWLQVAFYMHPVYDNYELYGLDLLSVSRPIQGSFLVYGFEHYKEDYKSMTTDMESLNRVAEISDFISEQVEVQITMDLLDNIHKLSNQKQFKAEIFKRRL